MIPAKKEMVKNYIKKKILSDPTLSEILGLLLYKLYGNENLTTVTEKERVKKLIINEILLDQSLSERLDFLLEIIYGNETQVTEKQICVHDDTPPEGSRPGACSGDSGGPMMCGSGHNVLAGITSWVIKDYNECRGNYPSVFTRVSAYRDWIYQYARV